MLASFPTHLKRKELLLYRPIIADISHTGVGAGSILKVGKLKILFIKEAAAGLRQCDRDIRVQHVLVEFVLQDLTVTVSCAVA